MKNKILPSIILMLFPIYLLYGQVPQGFNYQAIARGSDGKELANTPLLVKISVLSDTTGFFPSGLGTYIWEEQHSVTTNDLGLFVVNVGDPAALKIQGLPASFNGIDWKLQGLFIGTKIFYSGSWKILGAARLNSVPYSMISGDLSGPVKKLSVEAATDSGIDSSLFEVRNKNGQIVFAVYNEGVRIYVDDGNKGTKGGFAIGGFSSGKAASQPYFVVGHDSIRGYIFDDPLLKGLKGGFAIGGFNGAKVATNDYMLVSPDSTRIFVDGGTTKGRKGGFAIGGFSAGKPGKQNLLTVSDDSVRVYIDDQLAKGLKGGFAIGGFSPAKGNTASFFNVFPDSTGKVNPSQNRILWYPLKNAFLTGRVLVELRDSVGVNSFASGYESKAKGNYSQAMGYKAYARGQYSTAIGKNAVAQKDNSFAFGDGVQANGLNSYSFGKSAIASGSISFAFGESSTATASYSYAFGKSSSAKNTYAVSMGNAAIAEGLSSYAIGESAHSYNQYSYAIGRNAKAQNDYAIAMGQGATASGLNSFAINGTASAEGSFAVNGTAAGSYSKAFGGTASAAYSLTSGHSVSTDVAADYAIAMGNTVMANGKYSVAIGVGSRIPPVTYTLAAGESSIALGSVVKANAKKSIAIGSGAISNGENAVAIGTIPTANGVASMALGNFVVAGSAWSTAMGYNNLSYGNATSVVTTDPLFMIGNGFSGTESNALMILKSGYMGVGTSYPLVPLHIKGNAGLLNLEGSDHCFIQFYPDGIATRKGYFGFPGGTSNDISLTNEIAAGDLLLMPGSSGFVGVNNSSPSYKLDVSGTMRVTGQLIFNDPFTRTVASPRYMYVNASGEVGGISSSIKYKENVIDLVDTEWLFELRPVTYNYRNSVVPELYYGLIAEEVDTVNGNLVIYGSDGKPDGLMYEKLTVPMLKVIQDQQKKIESLNEKVARLETMITGMQSLLEKSGTKE